MHEKIYMYILAMYMSMCSGLTLKIIIARRCNMEYRYNMYVIEMLECWRLEIGKVEIDSLM